MLNMAIQDICRGRGVCFIDPGDSGKKLLTLIPQDRKQDTLYFHYKTCPIPISVFPPGNLNEDELESLQEDLIITFKRLCGSQGQFGATMEEIIQWCVAALVRVKGSTFLDIYRMIINEQRPLETEGFRDRVLKKVGTQEMRDFWKRTKPADAASILRRVTPFLTRQTLRNILDVRNAPLNVAEIMERGKILIVDLSGIPEMPASVIGSIISSQIQQQLIRRADMHERDRKPFYLYVDEFHNFATSAFAKIMNECRKYGIVLTIGHVFPSQVKDDIVRDTAIGVSGNIILFRSKGKDAALFKEYLEDYYEMKDVVRLPNYTAVRLNHKGAWMFDTRPPARKADGVPSYASEIIEQSRALIPPDVNGRDSPVQSEESPPPDDDFSNPPPDE